MKNTLPWVEVGATKDYRDVDWSAYDPADLPPGEYVLQIIVTDALADERHRTATQWIDFELVS